MAGRSAQANAAIPWTVRAVEICLGLAVAIPPFVFGARQAYGQLVLAVFVLLAFAFWIAGKIALGPIGIPLRRPEFLLPLAAIALSIVTWLSLPPLSHPHAGAGDRQVAPGLDRANLGCACRLDTLSLTPGLSRDGTFLFVLYALLFG